MGHTPLICVDEPSTFPMAIQRAVEDSLPTLRSYLQRVGERTDTGIHCALENSCIYSDDTLMALCMKVRDCLECSKLEGFHNTRVLRKTELSENGLQLLSPEQYFLRMRSTFTELSISGSMQDSVYDKLKEYLDNRHGNRTDMLSFFTPYSLCQEYWKFTKNIGGEVCEFALSGSFPEVYEKLTSHGYPITAKFAFPFCDVVSWQKDTIAFEFIRHYAARLILDYDYKVAFESAVTKPIPPQDILDVIDFIDEFEET